MNKSNNVLVLGSNGMVGSAIARNLVSGNYENILKPTRNELDLFDSNSVKKYFNDCKPEYIFLAAAKVGGILANSSQQVEFGRDNMRIQMNVLDAAAEGCEKGYVKKLLFLGSSCIYPKNCPQPIKEEYLLTGPLEETNHMYALSKIHGLKMCQAYKKQYGYNFISCMPTNLYGINDNFDEKTSHVLPAIIRKIHNAKDNNIKPIFWGDGSPRREFLYVDDMAEACIFLMKNYNGVDTVNVGYGYDMTIKEAVTEIKKVIGYDDDVEWDTTKPNGTMRKMLDSSYLNSIGWQPKFSFSEGIQKTYDWFKGNK